ncbi:MAG: hypothetical protein P8O70_05345 [SAR324 cluster bacterium]|nr:hypothetical protein [SAR324 cluster bacterium]
MSIFGSKFQNDLPFKEGEYLATMLRMDWKDTKAGDPMMVVEFVTTECRRIGKVMFPQVNAFFEDEAKQACQVLLGVAEPEDFETFFKLAHQRASRSIFKLLVKNHQKPDGNITQNFLVRDGEQMFSDWLDKQIDKEELRRGLAMERA